MPSACHVSNSRQIVDPAIFQKVDDETVLGQCAAPAVYGSERALGEIVSVLVSQRWHSSRSLSALRSIVAVYLNYLNRQRIASQKCILCRGQISPSMCRALDPPTLYMTIAKFPERGQISLHFVAVLFAISVACGKKKQTIYKLLT